MNDITYAYLETTDYCNLDCSFCNRKEVTDGLNFMSLKKWDTLLDKIGYHPIKEAKLMGMGEPFMHPKFDEICKMFKHKFPKSYVISATNCQYDISKRSKKRGVLENSMKYIDMLYLSIDGYKEAYERDRKLSSWGKLIKFLEELQTLDRNNCRIVVNYVVNPKNISYISKIEELRKYYNLEELRLNIAQNWSQDEGMIVDYTDYDLHYLRTEWKDNIKGKHEWNYSDCFWPKTGLYVTATGDVKVCALNTSAKSLGNIFKEDIDDIRLKKSFQGIANGCHNNNPTDHCKNCSYKELVPILKKIKTL